MTVEAAFVFPLVMMCFCLAIWTGIDLCETVQKQVEEYAAKKPIDAIACMYRRDYFEKLLGEYHGD